MAKLTVNEGAVRGYTHTIKLDYLDLIAIGNGGQKTIAKIPAGGAVEMVGVHKTVAAVGSTTVVFDVGTTGGDPDEFINALDADAMTAPVFNTGDLFVGNQSEPQGYAAATDVLFEVNDSAVASLTAGEWIIGLRILDIGT